MFGLGALELGIIGVVAMMVFGPKRLPQLAKGLAESIRELKGSGKVVKEQLDDVQQAIDE